MPEVGGQEDDAEGDGRQDDDRGRSGSPPVEAEPIREALAGRLAMLGNAGMLGIDDADVAAQHFIALTQARLPELTVGGTQPRDQALIEESVNRGVDAFLRDSVTARASGPAVSVGCASRWRASSGSHPSQEPERAARSQELVAAPRRIGA